MKKLLMVMVVLTFSLCLSSPIARAQAPAPGGFFNTAYRVQNLDPSLQNNCYSEYYETGGELKFTSSSVPVNPGDSLYVYMPNVTSLMDGGYAITVRCSRNAAAVANISDSDSGASHNGIAQPANTWYAPAVYDNYYNFYSNIYVRNTTPYDQPVFLYIYSSSSSTPVYTTYEVIPANGTRIFYQEGLSQLNNNQYYSAKIEGVGSIVTVNIYGRYPKDDQLYSYNALTSNATKWYAPVVMKYYYGYNTADSQTAEINVQFSNGLTLPYYIQPNSVKSINIQDIEENLLPSGNLYSATILSVDAPPRNLIVVVNESNAYHRAATYNGFSLGSTSVRVPIVMKRYYNFNSSVTCQNVGTSETIMTIDYPYPYGQTSSPSIPPRSNHMFYQRTDPALSNVPINFISSATITASQPIVCVVNQDQDEPPNSTIVMDQLFAYNGIVP